jgi:iron complex outermembrane receptor protein
VYSASKFNQKAADAPASVTVVTRDDIRKHGYRTLADVIRSVRGMYAYTGGIYDYVGVRGFGRPGDYNTRVLLLIDGYRATENVFDSAYFGNESLIDIDLVERVEFVRGASSALYGGNALFGVVNVITRKPADMPNGEVAVATSSRRTNEARLTLAKVMDNGAELLLSASGLRSPGRTQYFADFADPATNFGKAGGVDYEGNERLFGKFSQGGLTFTGGYVSRLKGYGNGYYGSDFNDPRTRSIDALSFADLTYSKPLTDRVDLTPKTSYGSYRSRETTYYSGVENRYDSEGIWWTTEAKVLAALSARHRILAGLEYQKNAKQENRSVDVDPAMTYFDERRRSRRYGIYVQDDYSWTDALTTSVGARYDSLATGDNVTSPRLATVYRASAATTLKAMRGTAFRAPNIVAGAVHRA